MTELRYARGSMPSHLELRDDIRCPCGVPTVATLITTGPTCDVQQECEHGHRFRLTVHGEPPTIYVERT